MELRNFIDGKFIDSISKKNIPVLNPANQKIVGNIDEALDEEIKDQLPKPQTLYSAYKDIIPAVIKKSKNPDYYIPVQVPNN